MYVGGVLSMYARLLPYIDMAENILKINALMCWILSLLVYLCITPTGQRNNKDYDNSRIKTQSNKHV